MYLEWKIEAQGADLTAVVSENADGFTATIHGQIVTPMLAGDSEKEDRIIRDQQYAPAEVRAQSLDELKRVVEKRIEKDGFRYIRWLDD